MINSFFSFHCSSKQGTYDFRVFLISELSHEELQKIKLW